MHKQQEIDIIFLIYKITNFFNSQEYEYLRQNLTKGTFGDTGTQNERSQKMTEAFKKAKQRCFDPQAAMEGKTFSRLEDFRDEGLIDS